MTDTAWIVWGLPATALVIAGLLLLLAWFISWDFDRRYGRGPK
jgi:cytochrome c-type biogenesis protein CcmH/NrfF